MSRYLRALEPPVKAAPAGLRFDIACDNSPVGASRTRWFAITSTAARRRAIEDMSPRDLAEFAAYCRHHPDLHEVLADIIRTVPPHKLNRHLTYAAFVSLWHVLGLTAPAVGPQWPKGDRPFRIVA